MYSTLSFLVVEIKLLLTFQANLSIKTPVFDVRYFISTMPQFPSNKKHTQTKTHTKCNHQSVLAICICIHVNEKKIIAAVCASVARSDCISQCDFLLVYTLSFWLRIKKTIYIFVNVNVFNCDYECVQQPIYRGLR